MQNDVCPITLDPLADKPRDEVFVHADVGFDMLALYTYLIQAPRFTNPVNRIPFAIGELEVLERQMETVFGKDCILYNEDVDDDEIARPGDGDAGDDEDGDSHRELAVDWLDETELVSRLNTSITTVSTDSNARVIRLRVDIDLGDAGASLKEESEESEEAGEEVGVAVVEDDGKEDEEDLDQEDEFQHISQDSLPPRRTFPSVTDMYRDTGRQRRISDRISLLQFLEYDAMNLLVQMMDMVYDDHFHRFVWQHTSLDVIDTVTTYLTDQDPSPNGNVYTHMTEPSPNTTSPADYDLEVVYTECWEIYRQVLLHTLERRYTEVALDVLNLDRTDARALFACHRAYVEQKAREQNVEYDAVLSIIERVEQDLMPAPRT
jgi:hypothetical protein